MLFYSQETAQEHDLGWTVVLNWAATNANVFETHQWDAIQVEIRRLALGNLISYDQVCVDLYRIDRKFGGINIWRIGFTKRLANSKFGDFASSNKMT